MNEKIHKKHSGEVRITGGVLGGRKIATPGRATHPMGERERLALFNMLGSSLADLTVLDAFAGSGALGIEALSRGAKEAVFIEKNSEARATIKNNLQNLGCDGQVIGEKVGDFKSEKKFDLILADPPYDDFKEAEIQHLVEFLGNGGILVLSHPEKAPDFTGVDLIKTRQYAAAHLSIYHKN